MMHGEHIFKLGGIAAESLSISKNSNSKLPRGLL